MKVVKVIKDLIREEIRKLGIEEEGTRWISIRLSRLPALHAPDGIFDVDSLIEKNIAELRIPDA